MHSSLAAASIKMACSSTYNCFTAAYSHSLQHACTSYEATLWQCYCCWLSLQMRHCHAGVSMAVVLPQSGLMWQSVAIIGKKALKKRTPCSDSLEQSGSTPREVSSREQCITTLSLPPHQAVVRLIIAAMAIIRCALLKIEQGVCGGLITIFNQPRLHSKSPNSSLGLKWSCL
jgi:hypothetical protein